MSSDYQTEERNNDIIEIKDEIKAYIDRISPVYKLNILDPVIYNNEIIWEGKRNINIQENRLTLLPSFENEVVLVINCNTGYIPYKIAEQAKHCVAVDPDGGIMTIPKYILNKKNNNIKNIEFHNVYFEVGMYRKINYVDTILYLSINNVNYIKKIISQLLKLVDKRIIFEIVIENNKNEIIDFFNNYGNVKFYGDTAYENMGLFELYIDNRKITHQQKPVEKKVNNINKEINMEEMTVKGLLIEIHKQCQDILKEIKSGL
jgi:SAM-dependent methyltransferase